MTSETKLILKLNHDLKTSLNLQSYEKKNMSSIQ